MLWSRKQLEESKVKTKKVGRHGTKTCPNCGGEKGGGYCEECGAELVQFFDLDQKVEELENFASYVELQL